MTKSVANKAQIVDAVRSASGKTLKESREIVDLVLSAIHGELADNKSVRLMNFGTFDLVDRAERAGRNPQTGEALTIPAKTVVRFRPGRALKQDTAK